MKAKCPYCDSECCVQCQDGFVEASFPSGNDTKMWIKMCKNCGATAGGCFSGPGLPTPRISPRAVCPGCGRSDLEFVEAEMNGFDWWSHSVV